MPAFKRFFNSTTTQLASTYLLIIMLMSIGFSFVFYDISSQALNRQVPRANSIFHNEAANNNYQPPPDSDTLIHDFLAARADEGRQTLALRLVIINGGLLLIGAGFSYYLARRSLRPIEDAMEAQAQFVSDASHELRTPLTAIQTSNEVALRNRKLTLVDAKELIRDNSHEVTKLKLLSDGLLNLAQNDRRPRHLQPVSISTVVSNAINQIIPVAQAKNISVEDTSPKWQVLSSETALAQVLVSIFDNAIKYSEPATTIHVSASKKGSYAYLQIRDEGVGIRASDLPHIFRRFYRADAARSDGHSQGYGLGLAIADSIMRAHDASISVKSELGKGSTFTIKLKLSDKS